MISLKGCLPLQTAPETRPALRDDGTPYYVQLAAIIRRQIADESWNVGDKLPTLKQLVATFGVSPMTVRHALAGLEQEGLISAERGRGTFVTSKPELPMSIPYLLTRSPGQPTRELTFRSVISRPAADELKIMPEEGGILPHYRYMKRIFARNGRPFIVGEYLVADSVHSQIPDRAWSTELVSTLLYDTKSVGLAHVRQTFRVVAAMPQEATELDIGVHEPVVRVRRIFQNAARQVLCLAQLVYRTDGVVFDININVDIDDRNRLFELAGYPES